MAMPSNTAWINTITENVPATGTTAATTTNYGLETFFDHVKYSDSNSFTLKDLADTIKNFFKRQAFMHYSHTTPVNYSKTMEWYQVVKDSSEEVLDTRLVYEED